MPTNDNDAILARIRGVPAKHVSRLEAMADPTNPNRYEANDNEAVTSSCGCVFCDLELDPELIGNEWVHEAYGRRLPCTKTVQ